MSDQGRACQTCRYWVSQQSEGRGMCHRMPPVAQPGYLAVFPMVLKTGWCGEYVTGRKR